MKKGILLIAFIALVSFVNAQNIFDTVSFETPSNKIKINNTVGNLWQIGKPQKTIFNSAYSGNKAIVTDTINDYPANDTSSFIYVMRAPFTASCYTCFEFKHKYDMDTLGDKGIIEASYDGGNSWITMKDTSGSGNFSGPYHFQWSYDVNLSHGTYYTHNLISHGNSDGWIKSEFCWQWMIMVK